MKAQKVVQFQREQKSKLTKLLQVKLKYIGQTLIKLGCQLIASNQKESQQYLSMCMQATDCRLELIEWLIAVINPGYNLDSDYKNSYDDDPHAHKVKRLKIVLWQVGVLPMSKHTKNMDYQKYVSGLLGYESAVNLIYDLCELAQSKYSANIIKIQQRAGELLGDLIRNRNQLVNVDYDPYGVTFPPKFNHNSEQDVNKLNEAYNRLVSQLRQMNTPQKDSRQDKDPTQLIDQMDGYKQLFTRKYSKLCQGMQRVISQYQNIVPTQNAKQITQLHNKRMLNISKDVCKGYRNYNKLISQIRTQQFNTGIKQLKDQVAALINGINEVQHLFA